MQLIMCNSNSDTYAFLIDDPNRQIEDWETEIIINTKNTNTALIEIFSSLQDYGLPFDCLENANKFFKFKKVR